MRSPGTPSKGYWPSVLADRFQVSYDRPGMGPARSAPRRSGRPSRFSVLPVAELLAFCLALCLVGLQLGPARAADLPVTLISVTSPAAPFSDATLTVSTAPGASCSIVVHYKSGPSRAKGLIPKVASSSGRVSWTWRVGSNTTPGRWPIVVTCEKGADHGDLRTSFQVG
jgi:hypothetical protein